LTGGDGDDVLNGGAGTDILVGGAGADRFVFRSATQAGIGTARDVIEDFESGVDMIDLSAIDANVRAKGNQAFGENLVMGFSESAGQLLLAAVGGDLVVSGDTNGDGLADFEILLRDVTGITRDDFIL
jgi:Ca2+-binding RTX toxin-like protein